MTRAVVFAYHNVGVRCLSVLLAHGIDVALVVTHADKPDERIWFASVAALAARHDIPVLMPDDANTPELQAKISALRPDFIFSFYYRQMLSTGLLACATHAAYNMHGSLLPRYRGRVPVNWAIIHGERETGASLHRMVEKPDAGELIAQQAVPILPDDTALDVFHKVTVAAELCLDTVLPALIRGDAAGQPMNLAAGSYFGGRRPDDGRIDWHQPAAAIHNLVRALAPPYPRAFSDLAHGRLHLARTRLAPDHRAFYPQPTLYREGERVWIDCADGQSLRLLEWEGNWGDTPVTLPVSPLA